MPMATLPTFKPSMVCQSFILPTLIVSTLCRPYKNGGKGYKRSHERLHNLGVALHMILLSLE